MSSLQGSSKDKKIDIKKELPPLIEALANALEEKGLKPTIEPVKCPDCKDGEYRCLLCIQRELDNLQTDLMEIHILEKMSATEIQRMVDVSRRVLLK